ncbi:Phenoloxidase subunit A3 [Trachymyrmex zeteki]|uniref:Phenoloxidase subunit A3 n=1 Tax=Mycetomoellerius zeteki TaxID=64791 RepID=A0A151WQH6_9HYME|nr:Phenoloxidase subunit A3 [Trachymyrmex zeteki]
MGSKKSDILYLFDRPAEPVYVPKGENKVAFDVPANYLPESRQQMAPAIVNRFADDTSSKVPVKQISLPDLSVPLQLGRREPFSLFIPKHRKLAARLIDIFLGMRTYDDFLSVSVYCRDRVNPEMFIYALSVAILNRPDTKDLPIPPLSEIFPDKYIDSGIFARAREEANVVPAGSRVPIEIPRDYTASDLDEEHRVAYWREDIGINLHHWHWHLVYPFETDIRIVNKDRRGELFYYMHHQIQTRYNAERLSNRLGRVKRFHNWREPIPEGYFPKLDSLVASRTWPARPAGAILKDINRPVDQLNFDLQDLERWRDRIYEAIHTGAYISPRGERVPLTEFGGIDVLGNIMEASILSPNQNVYGDLHNLGHVAISYCHDPDHRYLETFSIMGEPATAMRDPIFYRFHAFTDDVFLEHKNTLPEYDLQQVTIKTFSSIFANNTQSIIELFHRNLFEEIFKIRHFINTTSSTIVAQAVSHVVCNVAEVSHVGYVPFNAHNAHGIISSLCITLFMLYFIKFSLVKPGSNTIERKSTESSVTIPFERTFRNLDVNRPIGGDNLEQFNFCGCGWPQHMLVPKGKEEGFPMDLFIMISDYTGDAVEQDEPTGCKDAASFCGLRDRKYPDARPMGFPFDRRARAGVETLAQFLIGNMAVAQINIRHTDTILPRMRSGSMSNTLTFA